MVSALEMVFKYRQLAAACGAGEGLSFDDIELLTSIESFYAVEADEPGSRRWRDRPVLGTEAVNLSAVIRGGVVCDRVGVIAIGPEGLICTRAPYMDEGDCYEIVIDDAAEDVSYRFQAEVIWTEEDSEGELEVEMRFTGSPVLVRYGEHSTRPASHGDDAPASRRKPKAVVVSEHATATAA